MAQSEAVPAAISRLIDIEAIKQHKATYGRFVDQVPGRGKAAVSDLQTLFSSDCIVDFTHINGQRYDGHAGLMELFGVALFGAVSWMAHYFCNPVIEIDGERASAYWLLYALSTPRADPKAPPKITYGRYQDSYRRTDTGWVQTELRVSNETPASANLFVRAQP